MRWRLHGERSLYSSPWVSLGLADVELPDGRRFEHHVIRVGPAAGACVVDDRQRVLLLWRHRFITDTWSWEFPGGKVERGEDPAACAAREVEEETGWRPGPLRPLLQLRPSPGLSDSHHFVFYARGARRVGPPSDLTEAERVAWIPLGQVPTMIARGEINNGSTVAALLYLAARHQGAAQDRRGGPDPVEPDDPR